MIKSLSMMFMCLLLALPAYSDDGNAILQKVDRNLNPEAFEMYRKLINIEPNGSKKEFIMYSVKKGRDQIVSVFCPLPVKKAGPLCGWRKICGFTFRMSANRSASPASSR